MLYQRQKTLLALLNAFGGRLSSLDFQKLLFLYCQEWEEAVSYDFVPYRFGGFSFTSYADKRKLVERGLLADEEKAWQLTEAGKDAIRFPVTINHRTSRFAADYADLRGDDLVREAYRRHPWSATRSEMASRLFRDDPVTLERIREQSPIRGKSGICTIGYEGKSLEHYLNSLLKDGVSLLCDVRRNPLSRKYGFSKGVLSSSSEKLGIRYEHLRELGIESEKRQELKNQASFEKLFAYYEQASLPQQGAALARIRGWVSEGHRVALTCFELHPHRCHRRCVAEALERKFGSICQPHHL
ncbi:MAG: DUF488 domain-containing protein [Parvularcula sp.]|jgi:hypothetical protein|nr:DUF488 domain-containing protein [Parvularcula sp.]